MKKQKDYYYLCKYCCRKILVKDVVDFLIINEVCKECYKIKKHEIRPDLHGEKNGQ